jgi:hypothetical protein
MFGDRKWVIVNATDVTDEMIKNAIQSGMDTLKKSLDDSKAILKWDGDTPSCFEGMTTYSHSEIKTELSGDEWNGVG